MYNNILIVRGGNNLTKKEQISIWIYNIFEWTKYVPRPSTESLKNLNTILKSVKLVSFTQYYSSYKKGGGGMLFDFRYSISRIEMWVNLSTLKLQTGLANVTPAASVDNYLSQSYRAITVLYVVLYCKRSIPIYKMLKI